MTVTDVEVEIASHFAGVGWVAERLGVSRMTVYRAIKELRIPAVRTRDGVYLVDTRRLPDRLLRR